MMLINCSRCRRALQLPPGARAVRCAICYAVTYVADLHNVSAPPLPQNYGPAPPLPSPWGLLPPPAAAVHGRKRAVICGISYMYTRYELKGCVNDARCMKYLLVNRFGFHESAIVMLTEEETDLCRIPTKRNIMRALHWLVQGCQRGDSLVFHYSGHGSQQRNLTGDEVDGYDETLCPLDFETQGMIIDDQINETIVRPLPHGVKLHAIIDACHSGTVLDLPFLCRMDSTGRYAWEDHRPRSGIWKGSNGGDVISFSGCDDNQTSADTSALAGITSTGAMTFSFIQAIEHGHGATYGSILNAIRSTIRNTNGALGGGPVTSVLSMLLAGGSLGGLRQEPQLTSCYAIDVYQTPFSL